MKYRVVALDQYDSTVCIVPCFAIKDRMKDSSLWTRDLIVAKKRCIDLTNSLNELKRRGLNPTVIVGYQIVSELEPSDMEWDDDLLSD